jgi:adenylyl-sulfate kinase
VRCRVSGDLPIRLETMSSTLRRDPILRCRPVCVWLTGLSGSGKSTIARLLESRLAGMGLSPYVLDGDDLRAGLNKDLGFSDADRAENVRRVAEVARLMVDAGVVPIVSLISPFRADRALARARFAAGGFCEAFVDAPLEVCEKRDPKGLYARARRGEVLRMTGLGSAYEVPEAPELHLLTGVGEPGDSVERILLWLRGHSDRLADARPARGATTG